MDNLTMSSNTGTTYAVRRSAQHSSSSARSKTSRNSKRRPQRAKRSVARTLLSLVTFLLGAAVMVYPYAAQYINNLSATQLVAAYHEAV